MAKYLVLGWFIAVLLMTVIYLALRVLFGLPSVEVAVLLGILTGFGAIVIGMALHRRKLDG